MRKEDVDGDVVAPFHTTQEAMGNILQHGERQSGRLFGTVLGLKDIALDVDIGSHVLSDLGCRLRP